MIGAKGRRAAESSRGRGDAGIAGAWEILPLGLLVFVVGSLLVTNAWAVIDARMTVAAAAREASRAYVEAPSAHGAYELAQTAALQAVAGHGRDPARLELHGPGPDAAYRRCETVTFVATYPVPAISLPWIGGFGEAFEAKASHTEIVDPYRAGISGGATCA